MGAGCQPGNPIGVKLGEQSRWARSLLKIGPTRSRWLAPVHLTCLDAYWLASLATRTHTTPCGVLARAFPFSLFPAFWPAKQAISGIFLLFLQAKPAKTAKISPL